MESVNCAASPAPPIQRSPIRSTAIGATMNCGARMRLTIIFRATIAIGARWPRICGLPATRRVRCSAGALARGCVCATPDGVRRPGVRRYDDQYDGAGSSGLDSKYSATNVALYGSLDADLGAAQHALGRAARGAARGTLRRQRRCRRLRFRPRPITWSAAISPGTDAIAEASTSTSRWRGATRAAVSISARESSPSNAASVPNRCGASRPASSTRAPTTRCSLQIGCVLHAPPEHAGVSVRAAAAEQSLELRLLYPECQRRRELRTGRRRRLPAEQPLANIRQPSLLRTRYLGVSGLFASLDLDGRAQPFAPGYKASVAVEYNHPTGWFARLDASALGSYYYYTSDAQS